MIEKLLANPFTGDGTLHPDLHIIYVDEVFDDREGLDVRRRKRGKSSSLGMPEAP